MKNPAAVSLGQLARGVPKHYKTSYLRKLTERLAAARDKRWPVKVVSTAADKAHMQAATMRACRARKERQS